MSSINSSPRPYEELSEAERRAVTRTPASSGAQHLHFGTSMPSGGVHPIINARGRLSAAKQSDPEMRDFVSKT
jgi:hypothetical protein